MKTEKGILNLFVILYNSMSQDLNKERPNVSLNKFLLI